MIQLEPSQKRNIATLIFAVLTANSIPVTAGLIRQYMNIGIPIPLVENVGGVIGIAGLVALWWMYEKFM